MSAAWQTLHSCAIEPLGWMLLHSVWQIACLAAVYSVVTRCLQRSSAHVRYRWGSVTLVLMAVLPVATFIWFVPSLETSMQSRRSLLMTVDMHLPRRHRELSPTAPWRQCSQIPGTGQPELRPAAPQKSSSHCHEPRARHGSNRTSQASFLRGPLASSVFRCGTSGDGSPCSGWLG